MPGCLPCDAGGDGATLWDALSSRLIGDPRLAGPEALGYMRAFVAAADRNGINFWWALVGGWLGQQPGWG